MSNNDDTTTFDSAVSAEASASFSKQPCLIEVGGEHAGRIYCLNLPSYIVGRSLECDLVLDYEGVSRRHCNLLESPKGFELIDSRSRNGVFINGFETTRQVLKDGDKISLGPNAVLMYREFDLSETVALERLFEASAKDTLTGALNREGFVDWLSSQLQLEHSLPVDLAVIFLSLDQAEKLSKTQADELALQLYAVLSGGDRPLARIGSLDFVTAQSYTRGSDLDLLCQSLRNKVTNLRSPLPELLSVSLSVTSTRESAVPKAQRLFESGMRKLQLARQQGQGVFVR